MKKNKKRFEGWGTKSEIAFLKGLGTHRVEGRPLPRQTLLQRYQRYMARRDDWAGIDFKEVAAYVATAIKAGL